MMEKRGFMPFSAAGFLIVMLVVAMIGHAAWSQHHQTMNAIDDINSMSLLTVAAGVQNDLRHVARYAVYRALWQVCKHADNYENDEARVQAIEKLAAEYFLEHAKGLPRAYASARVRLELPNGWPSFNLRQAENGYVLAKVELPGRARIGISSLDSNTKLTLFCAGFEVWVDCRYFLLQERMRMFVYDIDEVCSSWKRAEYAAAWGQVLMGRVGLNDKRSRALFELAWKNHELNTFGSADCLEMSTSAEFNMSVPSDIDFSSNVDIAPMSVADAQRIKGHLDRTLAALRRAEVELKNVEGSIEAAINIVRKNSNLPENLDARSVLLGNVKKEMNRAVETLEKAGSSIREVGMEFEQLVAFVKSKAEGDLLMKLLYRGLTSSNGNYPPLARRVSLGVTGLEDKLVGLRWQMNTYVRKLSALDNLGLLEDQLVKLHENVKFQVWSLLAPPSSKYREEYREYPDPEVYDHEEGGPSSIVRSANVYILSEPDGTISSLRATLSDARSNLEKVESISKNLERKQEDLKGAEISEELRRAPVSSNPRFLDGLDREWVYETIPPPPIRKQPGLSVFHDFGIKDVRYERRDPLGWLDAGAPPTPIPLWFIGVTLYWAQWEVTLELEGTPVEEIFDFENPVLPRSLLEGSDGLTIVHKPLGYRFKVPREQFSFTLLIVSPTPFEIDA